MPSSIGQTLRVTVFGQSHSPAIGCVVEGVPAGLALDMDAVRAFMARRAPGQGPWATARVEADEPEVLGGLNPQGVTCGTPLAAVIRNTNVRSGDYANVRRVPRPGHADLTAWTKWGEAHDIAGGGHFSGRLTAPLCFAGAVCLQVLAERGVRVGAHLARVAGVDDEPLMTYDNSPEAAVHLAAQLDLLADGRSFPALDEDAGGRMREAIAEAARAGDSVGGVIECACMGLPAGIGSPMFDGLENSLARALFGIPAVKGVEFGRGFGAADLLGSQNNDPYEVRDGACMPVTNNAGGCLGGITTGAPVTFRMAVKPTPSIAQEQRSVDLAIMEPATLAVRGRHDPCIAPRAVPVAEAVMAICALDAWLSWPGPVTL